MSGAPKDLAKPGSANHTILVVDDEPAFLRLLSNYLKDAGFNMLMSRDGKTALKQARYAQPDLILLDVMLPGIDGFETCRRLQADETLRHIPVIFMSALIGTEDKVKGFQLAAVDYIPKPFQHEKVLGQVTTHLRLRDLARELRAAKESLERRVEERTAELIRANEALQAEIVERRRVGRLLQTLNAAALAMQGALTPDQVFVTAAGGFEKSDFHCTILSADEHQSRLFAKYLGFDATSLGAIEALAGVRQNAYSFAIEDVDVCKDVVRERKTLLLDAKMVEEVVRQAVPGSTNEFARHLVSLMGTPKSITAPLVIEDRVIGVLSIYSADLLESDMPAITAFAHQVAAAWHRAQLYQETLHGAAELAALNETSQAIASSLDLDEVLTKAMTGAKAMLNVEATSVLLHDATSDELVFAAVTGPASETLAGTRMPATAGVAGWALQEAQPVLVRNAQSDPRFYDRIDILSGLTTCSLLAVPLWYKETIIGVMEAVNKVGSPFDEHDVGLSIALANSIASAIENARLYEAEREQRRQVEQSQAQLVRSEKLAATGRLAASLAHEINNPLQIIHNSLQLMLNLPFGPDKQQEYLQMAAAEVERLMRIVTQILEFAGPAQCNMQSTDVNDVIEKALALTAKYLQHSHIELQRDLSRDLPLVAAAPDVLRQVFLNLMLNAVDAMPEGGFLHVSSWLGDDGRLAVAFTDTGPGIPPEHLGRIFEPFFSTKDQGTGLGLSISHEVVERHGGEIVVESAIGKGTTFTVWLPVISE